MRRTVVDGTPPHCRSARESMSYGSPLAIVAVAAALACARQVPPALNASEPPPARYLFAWTGDEDRNNRDFLAVIDLARHEDRLGDRYGTIVATTPVGEKGTWPHHTEYELGAGKMLFADGFSGNRNFLCASL